MKKIVGALLISVFGAVSLVSEPADAQAVCFGCCFSNYWCALPYGGACGYACWCSGIIGTGTAC